MKFKYIGDHPKVETLGHVFPAGIMVEVGEGAVAKKLMGNTCFEKQAIIEEEKPTQEQAELQVQDLPDEIEAEPLLVEEESINSAEHQGENMPAIRNKPVRKKGK